MVMLRIKFWETIISDIYMFMREEGLTTPRTWFIFYIGDHTYFHIMTNIGSVQKLAKQVF